MLDVSVSKFSMQPGVFLLTTIVLNLMEMDGNGGFSRWVNHPKCL